MKFTREDVERFNAFVSPEPNTGCLLWTGAAMGDYGGFWLAGKTLGAHRVAFLFAHGRFPRGVARHACDVGYCVRDDHVLEGTQAENVADKVRRGRQARGTQNGRAVLTVEQIGEMRRLRRDERLPYAVLGARFGVDRTTAWQAVTRKTWEGVA